MDSTWYSACKCELLSLLLLLFQPSCPSYAVVWEPIAEMSQHPRFQEGLWWLPRVHMDTSAPPCVWGGLCFCQGTPGACAEPTLYSLSPSPPACPDLLHQGRHGPASLGWVSSSFHAADSRSRSQVPMSHHNIGVTALDSPDWKLRGWLCLGHA